MVTNASLYDWNYHYTVVRRGRDRRKRIRGGIFQISPHTLEEEWLQTTLNCTGDFYIHIPLEIFQQWSDYTKARITPEILLCIAVELNQYERETILLDTRNKSAILCKADTLLRISSIEETCIWSHTRWKHYVEPRKVCSSGLPRSIIT